ncbi:MAG: S8 family peptidase [Elusimicrobia bacterium]|nr:S8 family peptidase [Elusimicrobiota bacterium]
MIIERNAARQSLAVALSLALFAGSPLGAFAQSRVASINMNAAGVVGALGAAGAARPLALSGPSLSAPALSAQLPAPVPSPALSPVEFLPAGGVRETLAPFIGALSDPNQAEGLVSQVFDSSRRFAASEENVVSGAFEDMEDVPAEAGALHKAYEAAAQRRLQAFEKEVEQVKSGRIGLRLPWQLTEQGKLSYAVVHTLDGKPLPLEGRGEALTAAGVSPEEWRAAKAEIARAAAELVKQLASLLQQNEREHQAVHRKMDALVQGAALKSMKESRRKAEELQAWGVPISLSVNHKTSVRYAMTYRLNGMPTDFGVALHDLLAPLIAEDPQFLGKITEVQLHEAAQYLSDSLKYTLDEETPDGVKRMRLGGGGEGYDYPEQRKALVDLARRKLVESPLPGDQLAGLRETPAALQPVPVLKGILTDLMGRFEAMAARGAAAEEMGPPARLLEAMHAAMGLPIRGARGMAMLPITHRQLRPILEELRRRDAEAEVVRAVIRAFPLGESLLRLGVDRLWAAGVTGKGVKVAVIDDGVDFDHPDMADIVDPLSENLTRDRGVHVKGDHGTPMASIIHAIAPDAEIQSYKALTNANLPGVAPSEPEIVEAVLRAMDRAKANGANIISMSLGFPKAYADHPVALKVSELAKAGVVVIVSAGNEGGALPKGAQIRSPASSPDAIAVGAVDYHGKIAEFSSEGVVFDPSNGTAAEKPDIYAPGANIKAAVRAPRALYAQELVPYVHVSGTSPAAPHVSGVAALMLGAALAAGADIVNAAIPAAVRAGLAAGARRIERLPVLSDAAAAVKALVERLTASGV